MIGKSDPILGKKINEHLVAKGVETPVVNHPLGRAISNETTKDEIARHMSSVMRLLGLDLTDDSLADTPNRIAKMYVDELFYGLNYDNFPKCTTVENKMDYDEMVVERATIKSVCEHHFVYFGTAHNTEKLGCYIAYMPGKKVLGLSKLSRIADFFSRRPQIQERLTLQIAYALQYILESEDVAVIMKGQHFCVLTRGVQDADSNTVTSYLGGRFRTDPNLKSELMRLIEFK